MAKKQTPVVAEVAEVQAETAKATPASPAAGDGDHAEAGVVVRVTAPAIYESNQHLLRGETLTVTASRAAALGHSVEIVAD